jgi:hypothetical protein
MLSEYKAHFTKFLWYDLHLNIEKLKVIKFMFGLNVRIQLLLRVPGLLE